MPQEDGECSIEDRFRELFFEAFLPAEAVVFCTPIYWYGVSAQTKAFFDRTFCYYAASYPNSAEVVGRMQGKRIGLVLASEETYPEPVSGSSTRSRNIPATQIPTSSASYVASATVVGR